MSEEEKAIRQQKKIREWQEQHAKQEKIKREEKEKKKLEQEASLSIYADVVESEYGDVRALHGSNQRIQVRLVPHPTNIVEPTALVAAGRPTLTYAPMLPRCIFESGR